jgi:hypothetical protein
MINGNVCADFLQEFYCRLLKRTDDILSANFHNINHDRNMKIGLFVCCGFLGWACHLICDLSDSFCKLGIQFFQTIINTQNPNQSITPHTMK